MGTIPEDWSAIEDSLRQSSSVFVKECLRAGCDAFPELVNVTAIGKHVPRRNFSLKNEGYSKAHQVTGLTNDTLSLVGSAEPRG
jgi:hypothetical protein